MANAGGDFSVMLPVSEVVVDGSQSSDDVAVTRWLWERDATSLAAGHVINGSDHSHILMVSAVYRHYHQRFLFFGAVALLQYIKLGDAEDGV